MPLCPSLSFRGCAPTESRLPYGIPPPARSERSRFSDDLPNHRRGRFPFPHAPHSPASEPSNSGGIRTGAPTHRHRRCPCPRQRSRHALGRRAPCPCQTAERLRGSCVGSRSRTGNGRPQGIDPLEVHAGECRPCRRGTGGVKEARPEELQHELVPPRAIQG